LTTPHQPAGAPASAPNNTLGLVSMILGILAIVLACCYYIGVGVGIAAVVLGFMGKQKADQGLATNRGMAMTGLICGAVAIALGILAGILTVSNVPVPGFN
jgi:hypothetical protein